MNDTFAITLTDVTKAYRGAPVLTRVSAGIARGRITVLLGPNGAGKTTLMRLVSGLARPTAGAITVAGLPPQSRPGQVGILFEDPHLYPHLTGWQNLRILSGRPLDDRLRDFASMMGLEDALLRRRARGYSFGQRRRLTLAALAHSPAEILLLDEPTNGLDPAGVDAFVRIARRMASEGRTLFVTGQDLGALSQLAQDLFTLHDHTLVRADDWDRPGADRVLALTSSDADTLFRAVTAHVGGRVRVVRRDDQVLVIGEADAVRALIPWVTSQTDVTLDAFALRDRDLRDVFERIS